MPAPFHLSETARTLEPGKAAFTGNAGLAWGDFGAGDGGSGRVRVGLPGDQEVGVEGLVTNVSAHTSIDLSGMGGGAKLSWKKSLAPWAAAVAGAGFGTARTGSSIGGDLAIVISKGDTLEPYAALRLSGAKRVTGTGPANRMGLVTVPVGLSVNASRELRFFFEGGLSAIFSDAFAQHSIEQPRGGAYLLLGLGVTFSP
jgi:hypothetical protein